MPASAAMPDAAPQQPAADADRDAPPSFLQRYGLRLAIGVIGVAVAAGVILTDDQDPIVFAIPVTVLTIVLITALTISGRGGAGSDELERAARDTGLDNDGVRAVPPVTALLRDDHAPAPMLSGDLDPYGPEVRVAFLRRRLVALIDLSEQPAGAHTDLGDAARAWLAEQPLHAEAELEDETLVLAVPRDTSPRALLDLARGLVPRL